MKRWLPLLTLLYALHAAAAITVRDDAGRTVTLPQPAQRIVSLAPHATELIFAAGGGDRIVGTVDYSDYPPAALRIPRVGNYQQFDLERIIALKPDLLVVWLHGSAERQLETLRRLGIPLFYSEPKKLADIPDSVARLGHLMGTDAQAGQVATAERAKLAQLAAQYSHRSPVRVFYQVWNRPLYTLNGRHILSDALRLCGGENVFADLDATAPVVSTEAVLLANPEAILTGARAGGATTGLDMWKSYPELTAVRNGNLYAIDADLLNRPGPRLIDGTAAICAKLDEARRHRQ